MSKISMILLLLNCNFAVNAQITNTYKYEGILTVNNQLSDGRYDFQLDIFDGQSSGD